MNVRFTSLALLSALFFARGSALASAPSLDDVRVDQHLGQQLPLDLTFCDDTGRSVALRDCLRGKPTVLALVYYGCPGLCTQTLNQLDRSLNAISESAGDQFQFVAVSFDARETPILAAEKKASYLRSYGRPTASAGWHFLTGDQRAIDQLTDAVGFRYRWDASAQLFAHPATIVILTGDGRISRYFLGSEYPPVELGNAIHAAGRGEIGVPAESIYFYCMRYDPNTGRYSVIIYRVLQILGVATTIGIVALIVLLQRHVNRRTPLDLRSSVSA